MSRFKAQFQSARSLDSDIVLATASAIAASNGKDSVGTNNTTEEMQEIPQQLPESAKLGSMVRQRGKIKQFINHLDINGSCIVLFHVKTVESLFICFFRIKNISTKIDASSNLRLWPSDYGGVIPSRKNVE